jgi:hypothetical protein
MKKLGKYITASLASAMALFTSPAYAFPKQWTETFYYSDASMTQEVGHREITCGGNADNWGIVTPYYTRIVWDDDCGA